MARRLKPRRGVLLLVVLSLLVLFVLSGMTFLLVAGHYQRTAIVASQHELTGDKPEKLLDTAMYELLRGTRNRQSSLFDHDLLGDLYGNDGLAGRVVQVQEIINRQIVRVAIQPELTNAFYRFVPRLDDYYNGAVITMTSGPAIGLSSRVIKSLPVLPGSRTALVNTLFVESFVSNQNEIISPLVNDRFIVNGVPFNGTGYGYNPTTGRMDLDDGAGGPIGLMPHFKTYDTYNRSTQRNAGGSDESFDAVGPQDMHLAKLPPVDMPDERIIPSFHRPQLLRYWLSRLQEQFGDEQLSLPVMQNIIRRTVMRPTQLEHPKFTGSNPSLDINSIRDEGGDWIDYALRLRDDDPKLLGRPPWDVDNDSDGIPDSVWVDLGLPNARTSDGRLYRPLFAILCTDLDGRVNLNAHGNRMHLLAGDGQLVQSAGMIAGAAGGIDAPRGLGYGPPEVNLLGIFGDAEYGNILRQRYADFAQRESFLGYPGYQDSSGRQTPPDTNEPLSAVKTALMPPDYVNSVVASSVDNYLSPTSTFRLNPYGSPPDSHGRGAVVVDKAGQPQFISMGLPDDRRDDPYEFNLNEPNAADSIYTAAELEGVLRDRDVDTPMLAKRLLAVAPNAFNAPALGQRNRRLVTTHSSHVPVPNLQLPTPVQRVNFTEQTGLPSATITEWMRVRLQASGMAVAEIPRQLRIMLPFEVRHGQKMDVNRMLANSPDEFGHQVDTDRNQIADADQNILLAMESVLSRAGAAAGAGPTAAAPSAQVTDFRNDDESTVGIRGRVAVTRQICARHLFCMAMLLLDPRYEDPTQEQDITQPQRRELTVQRIAQWAINAVDFRDSDSIMTPFEYDVNPMNGWQDSIDGDPGTLDLPTADDAINERRIVWGCEYPHLVLTETLAFHDLRLKDTDWDITGKKRDDNGNGYRDIDEENPEESEDDDLDQYRIPQGSFFAELYCTFDANNRHPDGGTVRRPPWELYSKDTNDRNYPEGAWKLDLARFPQTNNGGRYRRADGAAYPVWRLAISEGQSQANSVLAKLANEPDTTTLQPEAMNTFNPESVDIDRIVWFTARPPAPTTFQVERIFWNRLGMPAELAGKQYAVVGPRPATVIGSVESTTGASSSPATEMLRLDLQPGGSTFGDTFSPPISGVRPLGIVAAMNPPATWARQQQQDVFGPSGVGVNVSEPLPSLQGYYRAPEHRLNTAGGGRYPFTDAYAIENSLGKFPDEPFDVNRGAPLNPRPLEDDQLFGEGTYEAYRAVFLQRLANPLFPWNPPTGHSHHDAALPVNPYLTVDWMPVDLTIFNGEDRMPTNWVGTDEDKVWNSPQSPLLDDYRFSTRQRGDERNLRVPNILSWSLARLSDTNESLPNDHYFRHPLVHSLGYLNQTYGPPTSTPGHYMGDPQRPFPWLTWNDRPYANPMEMMLVPSSSPSRLLLEFTTNTRQNPYAKTRNVRDFRAPYNHLLNFFHSSSSRFPDTSPNYHRLLEFLEVPSRFVGTERWYNPAHFTKTTTGPPSPDDPRISFRSPFNKLSRFRDPGHVNINTVFDPRVWQAISHGFPTMSSRAFWETLEISRRGYARTDPKVYPSEYANPFRSSLGADLYADLMGLENTSAEASLFRPDPNNTDTPLFAYDSSQLYDDTDRNPYFRYQFLRRLGNIITTHSNVFANWITVGYFEIDPQTGLLGQELDMDTGNVRRHRAFYIVDRSIPVAYEPGHNHNVDRAILLRRFIE